MSCTAPAPPAVTSPALDPSSGRAWCVRLDWFDGCHTLSRPYPTEAKAVARARRARRYWSGPPGGLLTDCRVVSISRAAYAAHPADACHGAGCPR